MKKMSHNKKALISGIVGAFFFILGVAVHPVWLLFVFAPLISLLIFSLKIINKKAAEKQAERIAAFEALIEAIPKFEIKVDPTAEKTPQRSLVNLPYIEPRPLTKSTNISKIFPFAVIDVETTGLDRGRDRIISVSVIKFEHNFEPSCRFSTYVNPKRTIPKTATDINGITDDMVADAPTFAQIRESLNEFLAGCTLVGHNVHFDVEFLYKAGVDIGEKTLFFDTLALARKFIKEDNISDYKLVTVCRYMHIPFENVHNSDSDCYATSRLFEAFVNMVKNR